jgi:hypothetical protein
MLMAIILMDETRPQGLKPNVTYFATGNTGNAVWFIRAAVCARLALALGEKIEHCRIAS